MVELRPTVLRLQSHGVKVVIPAPGTPPLHFKGYLADAIASYGSANWTKHSLTLRERIALVRLTPDAAAAERTAFAAYFHGALDWDMHLCTSPHR